MKLQFDITPQEFGIIEEILANNLTNNCQVWVFGSRAKNSALFNSDLDLALECNHKIASKVLTQLRTDFEKSKLPYRVDILDICRVEPYFQEIINQKKILFPFKAKNKVPQLRFPEFSGEWQEKRLEEICSVERGKFTPRPRNNPIYYNGEIPFVQTGDVVHSKGLINTYSQTLNKKGLKVSKLFRKGDLLITIAANIGYAGVLQYDMACPDSLIGLKCTPKIENYFLNYLLEIEQPNMDYLAVVAAQKNINIDFLKPYKFNVPTKPEQQKIANFLTAVDSKISQLSKKQALLSDYKKGLMQKIFSQTIRFKADDGSEFADWQEHKLGDIGEFKTSSVDKKIVKGQKLIQLVNYMNVYKHKHINNVSIKDLMTVSANKTQLNSSCLKKGDILFTPSSETPDDIGHSVVIFEDLKDTLYSYHLMRFRPKVKLDILYSHYFCNISDVLRQISRVATGSTRFTVSVGEFSKIYVNLPSLKEQTKIANFLSSIDDKIKQVDKHLDKTKQFKKALLQQMFV